MVRATAAARLVNAPCCSRHRKLVGMLAACGVAGSACEREGREEAPTPVLQSAGCASPTIQIEFFVELVVINMQQSLSLL